MGNLILVRHSVTAASAARRNLGQRTDPPLAPEGASLGTPYDPYSVQRSTAELLGVTPLAKGARTESFASQLLAGGD